MQRSETPRPVGSLLQLLVRLLVQNNYDLANTYVLAYFLRLNWSTRLAVVIGSINNPLTSRKLILPPPLPATAPGAGGLPYPVTLFYP